RETRGATGWPFTPLCVCVCVCVCVCDNTVCVCVCVCVCLFFCDVVSQLLQGVKYPSLSAPVSLYLFSSVTMPLHSHASTHARTHAHTHTHTHTQISSQSS